MPYSRSLGLLVDACQKRAGGEGASLVDPTEIKSLISEYYGEMCTVIAEKGARYFEATQTITSTGAASYSLPADWLASLSVRVFLSGATGVAKPLAGPVSPQDHAIVAGQTGFAELWGFEGTSIALYPTPAAGATIAHVYTPQPPDLSASSDATMVDLINIYGWKFVVWSVASVALHKEQSNQRRAIEEAKRALDQLEYLATARSLTGPGYRVAEPADDEPFGLHDPRGLR